MVNIGRLGRREFEPQRRDKYCMGKDQEGCTVFRGGNGVIDGMSEKE